MMLVPQGGPSVDEFLVLGRVSETWEAKEGVALGNGSGLGYSDPGSYLGMNLSR